MWYFNLAKNDDDLFNPLQIGQQQPFVVERPHEPRVYDCHFTPVEDVGDGSVAASPIGRRLLPLEVLYGGEHVNGRYDWR